MGGTGTGYGRNSQEEYSLKQKTENRYKTFSNLIELGRTGGMVIGGIDALYQLMTDAGQRGLDSPKKYLTALGIMVGSYTIGTALHKLNDKRKQKALSKLEDSFK